MKKTTLFILSLILLVLSGLGCASPAVPEAEMTHYEIVASYDKESRTVTASQTVEFVNGYDLPVSTLAFRLYGNAYNTTGAVSPSVRDEAYYKGDSTGAITLGTFTMDGKVLPHTLSDSGHSVTVSLPKEVFPMEKVKVTFDFSLTLAEVNARLGVTEHTVNLTHWHPELCVLEDGEWVTDDFTAIGDPFLAESAVYKVTLTTPSEYKVVSGARMTAEREGAGMVTREFSVKGAREVSFIMSSEFKTVSTLAGSTLVTYAYIGDKNPEATMRTAQRAISLFSDEFGTYPFPTYTVVETPLIYSGMELTAMAMVDAKLEDKTHAVIHETAHQWWSQIAGNNPITHAFIDEGLAEWSTALYYRAHGETDKEREMRGSHEKRYVLFMDVMGSVTGEPSSVMAKALSDFVSEYEYEVIAYSKGYLMLDSLSALIGRRSLVDGLRRYYTDARYKIFDLSALIASVENGSGKRCEGIFRAWVDGRVTYYLLGNLE